ncbi:MAG: DUF2147 domain-containing protein [Gammaproteobacteria bacterium PRO9]|nr:DUF2147 domain-containing protein [Gammaproteobacteria bacterium PRO9]
MQPRSCLALAGALLAFSLVAGHDAAADTTPIDAAARAISGNWLTEPKDGIIQLAISADGELTGRIVGGNAPTRTDTHNPDASRRSQLLRGQVILRDMHYDGDGQWSGGTIYDPDSGKTYRCRITVTGAGTIKVRGFIGISLFGRSQTWTRYTATSLDLPATK